MMGKKEDILKNPRKEGGQVTEALKGGLSSQKEDTWQLYCPHLGFCLGFFF